MNCSVGTEKVSIIIEAIRAIGSIGAIGRKAGSGIAASVYNRSRPVVHLGREGISLQSVAIGSHLMQMHIPMVSTLRKGRDQFTIGRDRYPSDADAYTDGYIGHICHGTNNPIFSTVID